MERDDTLMELLQDWESVNLDFSSLQPLLVLQVRLSVFDQIQGRGFFPHEFLLLSLDEIVWLPLCQCCDVKMMDQMEMSLRKLPFQNETFESSTETVRMMKLPIHFQIKMLLLLIMLFSKTMSRTRKQGPIRQDLKRGSKKHFRRFHQDVGIREEVSFHVILLSTSSEVLVEICPFQ